MWTSVLMVGTNPFPDEYLFVAKYNIGYVLYFITFLTINVILLINLCISLYYANYRILFE